MNFGDLSIVFGALTVINGCVFVFGFWIGRNYEASLYEEVE